MNVPVLKTEPQTIARAPSATVVALNTPTPESCDRASCRRRGPSRSARCPRWSRSASYSASADALHESGRDPAVADQDLE